MYKNQLQELAQRSCFNLPSYSCIREGPDHAPRFKAMVNFNGEAFESPCFCSTLRQAEHAAAEVALTTLASRGPSRALAARVLDETGVYKNLLQETAHRARLHLPVYTTIRSGPGHNPVFSCTVELAGTSFIGEPARTKKQAQKNAALSAWSSLKQLAQRGSSSSPSTTEFKGSEEQEQAIVAQVLTNLHSSETRSFARTDPGLGHHRNNIPLFHNWAYPSYSPELAMYQIWHQDQLLLHNHHPHHQNRLFLPSIPSLAPMFPLVRSAIRPDQYLYFPPAVDRGPTLSDRCGSHRGVRPASTVTIREIQEEKLEDSPSAAVVVLDPAETSSRASKPVRDPGFEPVPVVDFLSPSQCPAPQRGLRPPLLLLPGAPPPPRPVSPIAIRTLGPASPVGFRPRNPASRFPGPPRMRTGNSSFMAPAVRIRSVVPVCSAPPQRKTPVLSQEGPKCQNEENVSEASSELDKLRI